MQANEHQLESLQLYIQNLKAENKSLQHRVDKLTQNSLLGDQLESQRISQINAQHSSNVSHLQSQLNTANHQYSLLEKSLKETKQTLNETLEENVKLTQKIEKVFLFCKNYGFFCFFNFFAHI